MVRKNISINLVGKNLSFFDRFIAWALSVGRVVVITIELIALSAFLYRFSLDRQLIDLRDKIKQEQKVLQFLKDDEKTFRDLQNRINLSSSLGVKTRDRAKLANDIFSLAPASIIFNNLFIQEDRMRMNITSGSVSSVSSFVKNLKLNPNIQSLIIEKIENRASSASITLSLTAILKK